MKLAYWMYAGPAHIGTLRIASSFKNVHAIMHAPLGEGQLLLGEPERDELNPAERRGVVLGSAA